MDKVKLAIIGCGSIANNAHGPNYAKLPQVDMAYTVDIIPERAEKLKEKFGADSTMAITDYKEMLKDPTVDIVSVCVPNYLHMPISVDCLNAGKHVLCEKPAALNYKEVLMMKEAADRNKKVLNIGVVNRFNTYVNAVRDHIINGDLGEVYQIYCSFRSYRSIPGLGGPFTTKAMAGGGVLIDWGVHFIDLILHCVDVHTLRSVSGAAHSRLGTNMREYVYKDMWSGPPNYDGIYDVEEYITGLVRTDGPVITINGAWAQNINENAMFIEFMGTMGGIKLQYGGQYTLYTIKDGQFAEEKPELEGKNMFENEMAAFVDSAMNNKKICSNVDNILLTAQMMDALYKSAKEGREIVF